MCEHCEILAEVLTELAGAKVAGVIMRRVTARLHPLAEDVPSPKILVVTA